jgi:hypothetical protein
MKFPKAPPTALWKSELARKGSTAGGIFLCALLGAVIAGVILRNGIQAGPDSWGYWEGSVSIIESGEYHRLMGEPITQWPPLFSAYLAAVQAMGSQSGTWLTAAMSLLAAFNILAWSFYVANVVSLTDAEGGIARVGSLAFVTLFVPLCCFMLLAQFLMLAFVGLAFALIVRLATARSSPRRRLTGCAALGFCLAAALLAHNSALVHVAASVVVLGCLAGPWRVRVLSCTMVATIALAPWVAVRSLLGQTTSHVFNGPVYSSKEYFLQVILSMGDFLLSYSLALVSLRFWLGLGVLSAVVAVLVFRRRLKVSAECQAAAAVALLSLAFLFGLFHLTRIKDPLAWRFLWFLPLALVPVLLRTSARNRLAFAGCLTLCLMSSVGRTIKWTALGVVSAVRVDAARVTDIHIRSWYFLTSDHFGRRPPGTRQVFPPTYPWMARWAQLSIPEEQRGTVRFVPAKSAAVPPPDTGRSSPSNATGSPVL